MVPAKVAGGVTYNHNMFIVEATGYLNQEAILKAYYEHCYDGKLMSLGTTIAVACTINLIKNIIDHSITYYDCK